MNRFHIRKVEEVLLGATNDIQMINVEDLVPFKNHPFKVLDDENMDGLMESIRENGILTPVLARSIGDKFEIISGHRRIHAAELIGLCEVPTIVKDMSDDEAILYMVDCNMQRESLLPSERAWSIKMKYDALKRQGKRTDLENGESKISSEEVGNEFGISAAQVKRFIKLTSLIPELMDFLDSKKINVGMGYDLSFIDSKSQKVISDYIIAGNKLNGKQVKRLRSYNSDGTLINAEDIPTIISDEKPKRKFSLSSKKINEYFPESMSEEEVSNTIMQLLEDWKSRK